MKKIFLVLILIIFNFQFARANGNRLLKFDDNFDVNSVGDLAKWENLDPYDFFSVEDNRLKVESSSEQITGGLIPDGAYWENNDDNFDIEFDYQITQGNPSLAMFLNFKDVDNYYLLILDGKHKYLRKAVNNHYVFISNVYHETDLFNIGVNYKIKIRFYLGEIFIFIDDELAWRVSDFSFNSTHYGRPMLAGFNSSGVDNPSTVYFDNFKYYLVPSNTILSVPYYGQGSPWWNIEEYNHGSTWTSNNSKFPTMARWGCAVTSMAMIFNYYGMNYLPDRTTPLDPGSLNNWLKSQSDGYVGEGLVNWMALTRLSRLIHEEYYQEEGDNFPKLETRVTKVEPRLSALSELHESRPVILMVPGHFMVGKGHSFGDIDIFINDPSSAVKQNLRDYELYNKPLLATRSFIPSFTDLSYFLVASSNQIDLVLKNKNGEILEGVFVDEQIDNRYASIDGNEDFIRTRQFYLAKPESGEYFIEVLNQDEIEDTIQVYLYDEQADFVSKSFSTNQENLNLKIEYFKNNIIESEVMSIDDFSELENLIEELRQAGEIKKKYVYVLLKKISSLAQNTNLEGKKRYWNLLKKLLIKFDQQTTEKAKEELNLILTAIENKFNF